MMRKRLAARVLAGGAVALALGCFAPAAAADPLKASAIVKQMTGRWGMPGAKPSATVHACDGNADLLKVEDNGTVTVGTDRWPDMDQGAKIEVPDASDGTEATQITLVEGVAMRGPTPYRIAISMPDADTMIMQLQLPGQAPKTYRRCAARAG